MGKIQQWLAVSSNEVFHGLAIPRAIKLGIRQGDYEAGKATGEKVLKLLEQRLTAEEWLVAGKPSVADVVIYPYVAMAPQGGLPLDGYLGIRKWIRRVEDLDGFTPLPPLPPKRT
jgi:glutathione S-transferase